MTLLLSFLLIIPFKTFALPSNDFWNPFLGDASNVSQTISEIIQSISNKIQQVATAIYNNTVVSRYKTPQRTNYGVKANYQPDLSVQDVGSDGTNCGGGPGDFFWASDCSCHCSTGKLSGKIYEATDRCPEDDNRTCEDCRKITKHDNTYLTVQECKVNF